MVLRKLIFNLHLWLGLIAGAVLSIVGVTGAMLSFEPQILQLINPGVVTVADAEKPLPPTALLQQIRRQQSAKTVTALTIHADTDLAAEVHYAPPPGQRRGSREYVHPATGELLGQAGGRAFFITVMKLHRWLLAGDLGKQIVGASTLILIVLALSGLYLRWPAKGRWKQLRSWFQINLRLRGRALWWHLHSKVGTWLLPVYLLACLSGLYWSYDWYRDGLFQLAGVERSHHGESAAATARLDNQVSLDRLWQAFEIAVPDYQKAQLPVKPATNADIRYLPAQAGHPRAYNTLTLSTADASIIKHEHYADKPLAEKLLGGIFPLHSGAYFGLGGLIVVMLASLLMPVFFISGLYLYLKRSRRRLSV